MRRRGQGVAVLVVLVVSAGLIHAGGTPAQKCAAAKNKAASKKIASKLRCYQKAYVAGKPVDLACLTAAEDKFSTTIAKIENKGGCAVNGDANAIEGAVDTCVNNIVALTPVTTTTTTTAPTCADGGVACGQQCGGACIGTCYPHCGSMQSVCITSPSSNMPCVDDTQCPPGQVCFSYTIPCGPSGCGIMDHSFCAPTCPE